MAGRRSADRITLRFRYERRFIAGKWLGSVNVSSQPPARRKSTGYARTRDK